MYFDELVEYIKLMIKKFKIVETLQECLVFRTYGK